MNHQFTITTLGSGSFLINMVFTAVPNNPYMMQVNLKINGVLATAHVTHRNGSSFLSFDAIDDIRHAFRHFELSPKEHDDCTDTVVRKVILTANSIFKKQLLNPQDLYDFLAKLPNFGEGGRVGRRMLKNIPLDELIEAVERSDKLLKILEQHGKMSLLGRS